MSSRRRWYPFNAEQTINLLSEMGPLVTMFVVNGIWGINAGTWALLIATVLSLVTSLAVLGRPPIMPFIAGGVSITFGTLALVTGNPMWVQLKVTVFNTLVALLLWLGLRSGRNFFEFVFGKSFHYSPEGWHRLTRNVAWFFLGTAVSNEIVRLTCKKIYIVALNRVITGIDLWILFKLVLVMPVTALFMWWQIRRMQKYRIPGPLRVDNTQ